MTSEADPVRPASVSLPGIPAYLRSIYELGRRSIRPGLPALAFLFLYRWGMSAYGALTNYSEALKGRYLGGKVVAQATPILLLALIYIPFLPLQESSSVGAGTLASHRGRGAQGALIARRIDDARALGCHTLTTEILPDQPGKKNPSSRNMERAGFRIACRRPNWVFPDPVAG